MLRCAQATLPLAAIAMQLHIIDGLGGQPSSLKASGRWFPLR